MGVLSREPYTRQQLIATYRRTHPELEAVPDNQVFAQIAAKYPAFAAGIQELKKTPYSPPGRSAGQVALDQAEEAALGVPQAVTQIPAIIAQLGRLGWQVGTGRESEAYKTGRGMVSGAAEPFITTGLQGAELMLPRMGLGQRDLGAPSPDDPRTAAAARGAGMMLGSALLPEVGARAVEVAPRVAPKIAAFVRRPGLTTAEVNRWMDVPANAVKRGADPGAQLLQDNLIGATKQITKANVDSALASTGQQMEQVLSNAKGTINGETPVVDALNAAKKRIGRPRDMTFHNTLDGIEQDIRTNYPNLDRLSPLEAHKLKVDLGESIRWKGEAFNDPINQVMVQIYNDLNGAIKNVPGVGELQARWGNLFVAQQNIADELAADVVGKGTGPGPPVRAPRPLTQALAKHGGKAIKWGGLGIGAEELFRYLANRQPRP